MSSAEEAAITDHPEAQRYEARVGDSVAGFVQYRSRPGLIALNHTEVRERFGGQGLAGRLTVFALEDAQARGLEVLPFCPFVNAYLQRHPEYIDLVPAAYRENFGLPRDGDLEGGGAAPADS